MVSGCNITHDSQKTNTSRNHKHDIALRLYKVMVVGIHTMYVDGLASGKEVKGMLILQFPNVTELRVVTASQHATHRF